MPSGPTIFIVDDDEAVRDSLKVLVEAHGLTAEVYGSGREFLEAHDPSLDGCVVLDVNMPGMSGLDVLDTLITNGDNKPVIIITGGGGAAARTVALRAGAVAFLEKPLQDQPLLETIQRALERRPSIPQEAF